MLTVQRRPKIPTPSVVVQRFSLNSRGHFKGEAERTDDHLCAACLDSPFRAVKLIRGWWKPTQLSAGTTARRSPHNWKGLPH